MTRNEPITLEARLVESQIGRMPRAPWRVVSRCRHGYPTVIASPSRLEDGTPFPTWAWLTCPFLSEQVATLESGGAVARWATRVASEPELAVALRAADAQMRLLRSAESGGDDACASVGLAGQRDPLLVKCLHAHVALALAGVDDPVGAEVLALTGDSCPDARCEERSCD